MIRMLVTRECAFVSLRECASDGERKNEQKRGKRRNDSRECAHASVRMRVCERLRETEGGVESKRGEETGISEY